MSYTPSSKSEYAFYSAATLADDESIQSSWIDTEQADKYQLEGVGSATGGGFDVLIESSSGPNGTGTTISTTTLSPQAFYLANVICRQRYMRFTWSNRTGTSVDASLAIKLSYGSSDKLSVLPLNSQPRDFSQAGLVRAVSTGQQPDGDYVNLRTDGSAFSSSALLDSDEAFLSDWVDTDGWNAISIFISTDQISAEQGIEIEFTNDVQADTPQVKATKRWSYKLADLYAGFMEISMKPLLDGFRVRYTNGSSAQETMYIEATLKTNGSSQTFNSAGALLNSDFLSEVALGHISNYEIDSKSGRNPGIDTGTTPEDIWNGGSLYTGQPASYTPETVQVFSSSAADTSAGTGARTVEIKGLRTSNSTSYTTETITLSGTTPVTSANTWWRVNRARVVTAGTGGKNAGTITIRASSTTANVFSVMPVGFNKSTIGAYTVPFNKVMLIKKVRAAIVRANGSAGSATMTLRSRPFNGVYETIRVYDISTSFGVDDVSSGGIIVPARSDVKFTMESVSDNGTIAKGSFEFLLLDI